MQCLGLKVNFFIYYPEQSTFSTSASQAIHAFPFNVTINALALAYIPLSTNSQARILEVDVLRGANTPLEAAETRATSITHSTTSEVLTDTLPTSELSASFCVQLHEHEHALRPIKADTAVLW